MNTLRDYQRFDVELIFEEWKEHKSTLYVAATGLGKTRVMTEVSRRFLPLRTIFLAHRTELITQARDAFMACGMECELEKAESVASTNLFTATPVVLASVQTLLSGSEERTRMQRFNPMDFGLLLYDESHHSVSPGNKRIVDYFTSGNPGLKVLGVTATPDRADEQALGQIFESVASERDILWGRDYGWLVDIEQMFVPVKGLDFSEVRTTCGDLNGADLAAVMESESCVQGVVQPTIETLFGLEPHALTNVPVAEWATLLHEKSPARKAIVFTVSVAQAEMLSNIFNRVLQGLSAWICGKTREDDRKNILKRFKAGGDIHILVNVGVTTEGYDNPAVDLIVMSRPTLSRSLYSQCIGRGTRPVPGLVDSCATAEDRKLAISASEKPCVTVLDFVGNSGRHKLISSADILGGKFSEDAIASSKRRAESNSKPVRMSELLEEEEERLRLEAEARRTQEEARKARLVAKANYTRVSVSPFDVFGLQPARARGWDDGKSLSTKQRDLLVKQGIDPSSMPYAQAKQVLVEIFKRFDTGQCSFKQARILKRYGYDTSMSRKEASTLLDALAKNNWRKLETFAA
jgi:superfamily II DNA or RNA helicase